jgi:aspartate oxidase
LTRHTSYVNLVTAPHCLQASSEDALRFLEALGLDLSVVVQLGGHSVPRTHSNPSGPNVGFALVRAVETAVRQQPNVRIVTNAKVSRCVCAPNKALLGAHDALWACSAS